jgi:Uma2 family endonuclease
MPKTAIKICPADHGRRMSLDEFDEAEVQEGYLYELSRGVITVSDVPKQRHSAQVNALRRILNAYDLAHPGQIDTISGGSDCKILLWDLQSERHPDFSIYETPMPAGQRIWSTWIPEIVIEVVSPSSKTSDYTQKPEEYMRFGVQEYWIVDAAKQEMVVVRRVRGRVTERTIRPPALYLTRLLPGLEFNCAQVFQAAAAAPQ